MQQETSASAAYTDPKTSLAKILGLGSEHIANRGSGSCAHFG